MNTDPIKSAEAKVCVCAGDVTQRKPCGRWCSITAVTKKGVRIYDAGAHWHGWVTWKTFKAKWHRRGD